MLVQFTAIKSAEGSYIYPEGTFGKTVKVGDLIIGEYEGETELTPYVGEWPIVEPQYRTNLLAWEFESLFTGAQIRQIDTATGTNDDIFKFWRLSVLAPTIDVTTDIVAAGLQALVDEPSITLFTADDVATITRGIPL